MATRKKGLQKRSATRGSVSDATSSSDSDEREVTAKKSSKKKVSPAEAPMEAAAAKAAKTTETKNRPKDRKQTQKKEADLLIELGDGGQASLLDGGTPQSTEVMPPVSLDTAAPTHGMSVSPVAALASGRSLSSAIDKSKLFSFTLLHFANGGGLNVEYSFTREECFYGANFNAIKLVLHNTTNLPLTNLCIGEQRLEDGMSLQPFGEVASLPAGGKSVVNLYVDFGGKTRGAKFDLKHDRGSFPVVLNPPAGELVAPLSLSEDAFDSLASSLKGMHEARQPIAGLGDKSSEVIVERVALLFNGYLVSSSDEMHKFAARAMTSDAAPLLLAIDVTDGQVRGNSEMTLLSRQITKDIKETLV